MFPICQVNSFKKMSSQMYETLATESSFHAGPSVKDTSSHRYRNNELDVNVKLKLDSSSDRLFGSLIELSDKLRHADKRFAQIANLYGVSISASESQGASTRSKGVSPDLFPAISHLKRIGSQHEMREKQLSSILAANGQDFECWGSSGLDSGLGVSKTRVVKESSSSFLDCSVGSNLYPLNDSQREPKCNNTDVGVTNNVSSRGIIQCAENPVTVLSERRKHHCSMCGYQTDNISHMRRHQCTVHNADKLYHCYICGMDFSRSERAKSHFLTIHPEIPYQSKMARKRPNESGPDSAAFAKNIRLNDVFPNAEQAAVQKTGCETIASRRSWEKYCKLVPPANGNGSYYFECLQCDYQGPNIWLLKRHYLDVHIRTGSYLCRVCHYSTGDMQRLVSHMTGHGELFCSRCSFSTVELDRFRAHLPLCNGPTGAGAACTDVPQCPVCGDEFGDCGAVKRHVADAHRRDYCEMCGCVVYGPESVNEHQRRQHATELDRAGNLLNGDDEVRQSSRMRFGRFSNQVYYCPVDECNFKATWKKSVELHTLNYHGCASVEDTTNGVESGQLVIDQSQVSVNGLFNCAFCPNHRTFKYRKSFEKHLLQHGVDYEKHPYLVVRNGQSEVNEGLPADQM